MKLAALAGRVLAKIGGRQVSGVYVDSVCGGAEVQKEAACRRVVVGLKGCLVSRETLHVHGDFSEISVGFNPGGYAVVDFHMQVGCACCDLGVHGDV